MLLVGFFIIKSSLFMRAVFRLMAQAGTEKVSERVKEGETNSTVTEIQGEKK